MILTRRSWLPLVLATLVLAPTTSAAAASTPRSADTQAVVNLTFDVTVGVFVAGDEMDETAAHDHSEYVPDSFARPTDAPLPASSLVTQLGFKLAPGTTIVISVFSTKLVNDSVCITGTSTKTPTVVYLSSKTLRPGLTRPYGCARPGGKPMVTPPSKAMLAALAQASLPDDLKSVSIAEESYATDNNGAWVADTLSRPTKAKLPAHDLLVEQGAELNVGDKVVVTLFTVSTPDDSFCITGTAIKTHRVLYLSSISDTLTKLRPRGCVAG